MWTSKTMTIGQSFAFSGMAMLIVFIVLAILALAIVVFAKLFSGKGKKPEAAKSVPAPAPVPAVASPAGGMTQDEIKAIAVSVICDDLGTKPENISIRSFREIQ